jgi:hypothetical protein
MTKKKLIRNLKRGDQIRVWDMDYKRSKLVTVSSVNETRKGFMTGRRQWRVTADFPWWWPCGIVGYSDDKIEVVY